MFCSQCGTMLDDGVTACPNCGAIVKIFHDSKAQTLITFGEAISNFFTKENFSTNGRASRAEFWWTYLFLFIVTCGIGVLWGAAAGMPIAKLTGLLGLFICGRRFHDVGKSGWFLLVPIYNIVLLCQPGDPKENKYGPPPHIRPKKDSVTVVQHQVKFADAVKKIFARENYSLRGRASRSEFWWMYLFLCCVDFLISFLFGEGAGDAFEWLMLIPMIFVGVRRVHDVGRSGWFLLIPLYDIVLLCLASESVENKYGPVPNLEPMCIEKPSMRNIGVAMAAIALAVIVGVNTDGDSAEDAFLRCAESICSEDAEKFFASVYVEGFDSAKLSSNKDVLIKMFEKLMREIRDDKMLKLMTSPKILDVEEHGGNGAITFTTKDEELCAEMAEEGFSGMMVETIKTDEGWKVCFNTIRPVFAFRSAVNEYLSRLPPAVAEKLSYLKDKVVVDGKEMTKYDLLQKLDNGEYRGDEYWEKTKLIDAPSEEQARASAKKAQDELVKAKIDLEKAVHKGRVLYLAIQAASVEREGCGLPSLWPHLADGDGLSDEEGDISSKKFSNATEYFKELFDVDNCKKGDWNPYVTGVDLDVLSLCGDEYKSGYFYDEYVDWMVVAGITDEMDDDFPVLISANIESSYLTFAKGRKNVGDDGRKIRIGSDANKYGHATWWDDAVVIVRKGGKVDVVRKGECTMKKIFGSNTVEVPGIAGVKCLDP